MRFNGFDMPASANFDMLRTAVDVAKDPKLEVKGMLEENNVHVGNVFTTDYFYHPQDGKLFPTLQKQNILAIDMETAGLYGISH